ncbi:selenide, water dikinase SelD [Candidatus Marinarcus aquaticus]|uniref:Selenide, water dikinase SelD n=1 Tax=Candidatus Marinarcus aquaticus TaxID=2044504 RepID=A0A4Q0XWX0_9BACT|nr:selenide, water dikinase SelD [Candidatus Marinarcus aquaticus]RXJ60779.1 selenide, water dikinase SelD [Candidatus Marinarcus aquaticus]
MNRDYPLTKLLPTQEHMTKYDAVNLEHVCHSCAQNKNLLIGPETLEDASVYQLNENEALVQTQELLAPMVDNPYSYGKIAAAHSLSSLFSMGATVKTAMSTLGYNASINDKALHNEILKGGDEKIKECGGVSMAYGSINSSSLMYGLSVLGTLHPKNIYKNNTAKIGHVLVLTKPLGMGILTSAIKKDLLDSNTIKEATHIMESLNYLPSQIMKKYDVSACTTVSYQGLLGHALASTTPFTSYNIHCGEVPVAPLAQELADQDVIPIETMQNMDYIDEHLTIMCNTSKCKLIYCDTQISGGLLIAMNKEDAKEYIKEIEELTFGYARIIGEVIPRGISALIVY